MEAVPDGILSRRRMWSCPQYRQDCLITGVAGDGPGAAVSLMAGLSAGALPLSGIG